MQLLNKTPFIAYDELIFHKRMKDWLIKKIKTLGEHDQYKTNIRLNYAKCKVYSPWKHQRRDFDLVRHLIGNKVSEMTGLQVWPRFDIWGLYYEGPDTHCGFHNHGKFDGYAGVYYLEADDNSGQLYLPEHDIYIEAKPNRIVVFDPSVKHGVLPSIAKDNSRVAIAFNCDAIENVVN